MTDHARYAHENLDVHVNSLAYPLRYQMPLHADGYQQIRDACDHLLGGTLSPDARAAVERVRDTMPTENAIPTQQMLDDLTKAEQLVRNQR